MRSSVMKERNISLAARNSDGGPSHQPQLDDVRPRVRTKARQEQIAVAQQGRRLVDRRRHD
jgi:hypothetical protein